MPRVRGWTEQELLGRERVFEGLIAKAVRMSLRPLSATLNRTLVAAGAPTISPEPGPVGPVLSPAQTTVVTATWTHYVDNELFPYLAQTFVDAAGAVRAGTEAALDVSVPPVTDSYAVAYLAAASNRLVNVGDVVWLAVRDQLVEGYAAGESTHQLAARVREVAEFTKHRAVAVARTEVVGAANAGSLAQLQLAGFTDEECSKRWLATEDERTRIAHHVADGQTVPLNQPFSVGGEGLQFPGDPRGRADNIIQCRCTVEYVFADDADPEEDIDLLTAGAFKRWLARLHPRGKGGLFVENGTPSAPPKMVKYVPTRPRNEFHILSKAQRGKSGDVMYAPGMYGRYGAAGVMIRHRDAGGTDRFLVVQRSTGKYNRWKWQLPGGALDEKETPAQGAARESFEEIGATPDVLDRLKLVGEHKVTLPVSGKAPWSYTNIAADIDKPFKPNIDYGELGAARWLTADQLHEMRGRGRLVAPFAEHLDTILAKFPDQLLTASVYKVAAKKALDAFDELKHPRAPKGAGHGHGGEFVKKGIGVGQVAALKPMKVNTKVIYNTKYKHMQIVAEKPGATPKRLVWDDVGQKFILQSWGGAAWHTDEVHGKGTAYKKFSQESGWVEPDTSPKGPTSNLGTKDWVEELKKMQDVESTPPKAALFNAPEAPPAEPKVKVKTPPTPGYASTKAVINKYFDQLDEKQWDALPLETQWELDDIANGQHDKGNPGPHNKIVQIIQSKVQIAHPVGEVPSDITQLTDGDFLIAAQKITPHEWTNLSLKQQVDIINRESKISEQLGGKTSASNHLIHLIDNYGLTASDPLNFPIKAPNVSPPGKKSFIENPWSMDPVNLPVMEQHEIDNFFKNLTEEKYFSFTEAEKKIVGKTVQNQAEVHDNIAPAEKISQFGSSAAADYLAGEIDELTTEELKVWLYDHLYPESWNDMSDPEKDHLWQQVVSHGPQIVAIFNELIAGGSGNTDAQGNLESNFDPTNIPGAYASPMDVNTYFDQLTLDQYNALSSADQAKISMLVDAAGNQGNTHPYHKFTEMLADINQGTVISNAINKMSKDELKAYIDQMDPVQWSGMLKDEQITLIGQMHKHNLGDILSDKINPENLAAPKATKTLPLGVPGTGQTSAYSTDHVKSVGSISTPSTTSLNFTSLTVEYAHNLQKSMLAKSGKGDWTTKEKNAVAEYTTSVGYQTTNAVMRNDVERMKLFSSSQLHAGVQRAVHLQTAMTPLTESVKLHRGTGAQAFGFKSTDVSHDELAQLVGSTISDKGFLSTSVVPPTSAGVGFDYATKKPIKMIINAPTGTPGVYVSTVTPGYSHENEFILAAGTTLRIDSVSGATPADKAKYGSSIKHLVVATVVPTSQASPVQHVVPPQPAAVISPLNAPKLQLPKPGASLKITTSIIFPKKGNEYEHGQIIAVKYRQDGSVDQLYWDAKLKKYGYRVSLKDKTGWYANSYYGKGEAFDTFAYGKGEYGKDWTLPAPGANVLQDVNSAVGEVKPTISGNPSGGIVSTANGAFGKAKISESKTPKLTADDIKTQYGIVPQLPQQQFTNFIGALKYNGPVGQINLNSTAPTIFKSLAAAVAGHNHANPNTAINLLQGIKLLDAKLTPKDKPNAGLYEAKVVDWLQTAAGKKNAQSFIDWADQLAKAPKVVTPSPSGDGFQTETITPASFKTPGEIGTPKKSVTAFGNISPSLATKMNAEMRAKHGPWTKEQVSVIENYTGSGSGTLNSALRNGKGSPGTLKKIATLQSAMAPVSQSFRVHRGTDGIGDLVGPHTSFTELEKLVNEEVIDKGFLSTSVGNTAAFGGKKFILEIDIPEGTPGAYVANHSSVGKDEREFIIAAGTKYKILAVDNKTGWQTIIKLRVIA